MYHRWLLAAVGSVLLFQFSPIAVQAAPAAPVLSVITPKEYLGGSQPGDDYYLANYEQLAGYMRTVAAQTDRAKLVSIGKTVQGRDQLMMIISSPENIRKLDHYKDIAARLAKAEGLTPDEARALAREGKAVVWISSGMHAIETSTTQAMFLQVHKALTDNDPEWLRILDDTIILLVHNNPDGTDLLSKWYMRNPEPTKRVGGMTMELGPLAHPPEPYHPYVGHDNNRDFLMIEMPESRNIMRVAFREWFPQIIYDHHQTAPPGLVVFLPPFRDPPNYSINPLTMTAVQEIGTSLHSRLVSEDKPGSGMRSVGPFTVWPNGGFRTTTYFHNSIGIVSEITGNPSPMELPLVPAAQLPRIDLPKPIGPQRWHLRQTLDYELSINRGVLDYASRNRERLLFNIYKMGADAIAKGQRDNWTITAHQVEELLSEAEKRPRPNVTSLYTAKNPTADPSLYQEILRKPENRDPRAYILSAAQKDFPTATKFVNALIRSGATVQRARTSFAAGGKIFPAGSYVVQTGQAYRALILDTFEPQYHPTETAYPGGPPIPPYDLAGYTLAYQMGVEFDRMLESVDGPFESLRDEVAPAPGQVIGSGGAGYLIEHAYNDAVILTSRLQKAEVPVSWIKEAISVDGRAFAPGAIWVPATPRSSAIVNESTRKLGIDAYAVGTAPDAEKISLKPARIGLVDVYTGSIPSGWTRWLLEGFELPYTRIYPQRLDAGRLERDFDVIIMPDELFLHRPGEREHPLANQPKPEQIPAKYRSWLGKITADKTIPQLDRFVRAGGTLMALGDTTAIGAMMNLPLTDATLTEGGKEILPRSQFFIPGSILRAQVNLALPITYGLKPEVDIPYGNNPTFRIAAGSSDVTPVLTFGPDKLLRSGWAIGEDHIKGSNPVVEVKRGDGRIVLMGSEITQRTQPHGVFKIFFNTILLAGQ